MNRSAAILACATFFVPAAAGAMNLVFPAQAQATAERALGHASYDLAVSPFRDGEMARIRAEGPLNVKAWRISSTGLTTLQILAPLREQLKSAGYTVLFECADKDCGGFDFRFQTEVLPEPDMHVDLGDYRYLAAQIAGPDGPQFVTLLVSRGSQTGFVQVTQIGGMAEGVVLTASTKSPDPTAIPGAALSLSDRLKSVGRATLEDLSFATGSSRLDGDRFSSLDALAAFLIADPARRVVLVGHTDAEGTLEGNVALSRKRALSVVELLVRAYGVPAGQISAQGVGYLAPRASNDTPDGRTKNRRVEAVLASTR